MTPDDEMLMAYADGELDPLAAKRVERAMACDPAMVETVASHRALRQQLGDSFAPVLTDPIPARLTAQLKTNVVPMVLPIVPKPQSRHWLSGLAVAASLVVGIALGTQWVGDDGPVTASGTILVASGELARTLDGQLTLEPGDTRVLVSFREHGGGFCRVFAAPALEGIACKAGDAWQLRQTRASAKQGDTLYRQAGSSDADLMAAAQNMMVGIPLDRPEEVRARKAGWR